MSAADRAEHAREAAVTVRSPSPRRAQDDEPYAPVHRALRREMAALLDADFADERVLDDLEGLLYLCERHSAHERRHYHAAIEARRPGATLHFEATHGALDAHVGELRTIAARVAEATDRSTRAAFAHVVSRRYAAFVGESLVHMAEEEEVLQPLLRALYAAEELAAIRAALLASMGPEEREAWRRVMEVGHVR